METQIFHHEKMISSKHPVKETKFLQDIVTLKLIQVSTQDKISSFKNPQKLKYFTVRKYNHQKIL
jgi:hypothetical protein